MPARPLAIPAGEGVRAAFPALLAMLAGTGPLLLPHAPDEEPPAPLRQAGPADRDGRAGVAVGTSGSTGRSKRAVLPADALRASARATHEVLGGPGRWVLALPPHHVAGLQVLLRSLAAGHEPVGVRWSGPFGAELAAAAARARAPRRYTSLVPTQLARLLAEPAGRSALGAFDAVLVGGAAASPALLDRAWEAGARVVATYGASETAGGCVYDGWPLPGVRVRVEDARVYLAGPMLATGYLGDPQESARVFVTEGGRRWFRTDDAGALAPDGRLAVTGRLDDLITTGGLKVAPAVVEAALEALLPPGAQVLVVGLPDPTWGHVVGALLAPPPGTDPAALGAARDILAALRGRLPAHALPRRLAVVAALPLLGPGKPDRARARAVLRGTSDVGQWQARRVEEG